MSRPTVLIVDDEQNITLGLEGVLKRGEQFEVLVAHNALEAVQQLESKGRAIDILITDIYLSLGPSGISLIEQLKRIYPNVGVIVISGRQYPEDLLKLIKLGIDDFIPKPLNANIIRDSINSTLLKRRIKLPRSTEGRIIVGPLELLVDERKVSWYRRELTLTPTEFCLLYTLAQAPDQFISAVVLVQRCRGYILTEEEASIVLKPHISNLRQKLEMEGRYERVIINKRTIGFALKIPPNTPGNFE